MSAHSATEDTRLSEALEHLRSILIDGETLESWAIQRRLFALTHRRTLVAATSGRFVALNRGLFGGFDMKDIRWQDLRDAKLRVGVFGADVSILASAMTDLAIAGSSPRFWNFRGLLKEQAQQVYRLAQTHEQAWREKRRVRELEELRARSGGVQISTASVPPPISGVTQQSGDSVARLQQAKQMLDAKLITDAEYESIKAKIIGNL